MRALIFRINASKLMQSPLKVFHDKKTRAEKLAMISLYDAPSAYLACEAGADALLVGDSLGNVILGFESTLHVTLDDMIRHTGAAARGAKSSSRPEVPIIADVPFGYCADGARALKAAIALVQSGAHAVKLEGASTRVLDAVDTLVQNGIPVMGHLGFTPQSSLQKREIVQARSRSSAEEILGEARKLEAAGCFGMVLEAVVLEAAARITRDLKISTIGIGAGPECDGQVLVWHDLIGLSPQNFRFSKRFADARGVLAQAARDYVEEVHAQKFPTPEHGWNMKPEAEV
jgi:3-methyl-2-oxobutanoate hydroxymethyltransferase